MINVIEWSIIAYFFSINTVYLLLVVSSLIYVRKQMLLSNVIKPSGLFQSNLYKTISILVPAYNEAENIVESIESLLRLEYPEYDIIVINDGSSDNTLGVLISHFDLQKTDLYYQQTISHQQVSGIYQSPDIPSLIVIDKENGGKADALNTGINVSENDLICAIDADSILEQDVLKKLIQTFITQKNTIAAGGIIRVINGCKIRNREIEAIHVPDTFWGRLQSVEYIRAFLFGRVGWDYLNSLVIISGAFGIFDRKALLEVGGYLPDTVGEDIELIIRMHSHFLKKKEEYHVRFLPEPICWTEVPTDYKSLKNQRNRWHRGLADSLWRHKYMFFNPKYKHIGLFVLPFFLIFELIGPIVILGSYIYIAALFLIPGYMSVPFVILFAAISIVYGMIVSLISVFAEEIAFKTYSSSKDVLILILYSFVENLGYRQIHAWWQITGLIDFIKGKKSWGQMKRKGFKSHSS
ncbi:glycosyltransferase family 2 protein [Rhodohalobacter sp. SW132]|uniref:glycosyltransferase family 2 protein n=1 Tax=Rhodohalobacter sp. SW132 TaxID=2293433 RepID=UPI000E226538|nr:glycosyltransferase [Rhodohalobacter sp. SW132]REL37948.1 glycosyltransferase family 2 protein [Rhodohalobacter sp. SW132]